MGAKQSKLFGADNTEYIYYEDAESGQSPKIMADDNGGLRYTRVYRTKGYPSSHVFGFIQALLGYTEYTAGTAGETSGTYSRPSPHRVLINNSTQQWRNGVMRTGPTYAYAVAINSIEYISARQQVDFREGSEVHFEGDYYWPEAEQALVSVEYQSLPYVVKDDGLADDIPTKGELDRYVSRRIQPAVQYAELPGGYLFFEKTAAEVQNNSSPYRVSTGLGFPIPHFDVTMTWHRLLFPPYSAGILLGRTNMPEGDTSITTYNRKPWDTHPVGEMFDGRYPPGTLLYLSYELKDYTSGTGQILYDISYRFRYYPYGVNYLYRYDLVSQGFNRVSSTGQPFSLLSELPNGDTRLPIKHAKFSDLFKPWLSEYPDSQQTNWHII